MTTPVDLPAYNSLIGMRMPWEVILNRAEKTPAAIAFIYRRDVCSSPPHKALTYSTLARRIGEIAVRLRNLGVDDVHPAALIASESLQATIALYAAELAGRAVVLLPEEDPGHNVQLARLCHVKVALIPADEFDPNLARRLRVEAGVAHVLHMNENDVNGSDGDLFEGETETLAFHGNPVAFQNAAETVPCLVIERAPWAYDRREIIDRLTSTANVDLHQELAKLHNARRKGVAGTRRGAAGIKHGSARVDGSGFGTG
jgi:hypothetical protein